MQGNIMGINRAAVLPGSHLTKYSHLCVYVMFDATLSATRVCLLLHFCARVPARAGPS